LVILPIYRLFRGRLIQTGSPRALAVTGKASIRKRKLPAEQVVWLVIALALYRHQSIPEVVAHLDLVLPDEVNPDIAKSALTQAR
jgi:hypothetical protein